MPYEGLDPFITEAELTTYLGRNVTAEDLATLAVGAASDLIRNAVGARLDNVEDDIILVDGSGTDTILLPELPVTEVTEVNYVTPDTDPELLDPAEDYLVDLRNGALVTRGGTWLEARGNYEVTYSHGYTDIPADLRVLALTVAARIYDQGIVKQESVGGYSATFSSPESMALTARELNLVAKYRPVRSAPSYDA